jgi:uncharacterized membrane protein YhaH (DUF805 family)
MIGLLFGFEGRIGRGLYWLVQVPLVGIVWIYADRVDPLLARWFPYSVFEGLTFALILAAPLIWVQVAITTKRYHDRGKSGFWSLLLLIPAIGWAWVLIECGLLAGARASAPPARQTAP